MKDLRETATGLRARHTDDWFFYQYQGDGSFLFWNEQYFRRNAGQEEDRFERNRDKVIRATESHLEQIIREFDLKQDLREFSWGNVQAMDSGSQDEKGDLLDLYTEAYSATFQRSLEGVQVLGVGSGGSITIRPSGQVVGVTADFATYQNSGERSDLVELNVARDRVKGLFKALNLNAAELTGVRCGYYDFGARIGYGEGELPLACSLAIRIDENGGAVMLHVPISEEIPDMTIFTEAQHLRGEYDEPEGDAPGDEK